MCNMLNQAHKQFSQYTDKKENQILLIYKEIQNGAGGDGVVEEAAAVTAVPGTAIPCTL